MDCEDAGRVQTLPRTCGVSVALSLPQDSDRVEDDSINGMPQLVDTNYNSTLACNPFMIQHSSPTNHLQSPPETTALLTRLASKPGVQSTLILSKVDGSIIQTSGLISEPPTASPPKTLRTATNGGALPNSASSVGITDTEREVADRGNIYEEGRAGGSTAMRSAEAMARMVWAFVEAAGGLVAGLDSEDEVKLLRLRTKTQEFVIVPGKCR